MNDPGADQAIDKAAKGLNLDTLDGVPAEDAAAKDRAAREKQRHDLHDPSIWWFASTGCPLLAGTFGPLANGFSICALVRGWRVYVPPGSKEVDGQRITDPPWLLAVNAISLFSALVANAALLLNMSRRLRFKVAQPISVIGFFIAGMLLIADIAAFVASPSYHLPPDSPAYPPDAHALSSAFYFGIEAAAIYVAITVLMCLTAWGAWRGHFEGGFRLTFAQRTLMVQTMAFVVYLLLGALVFSHVEGWEYLDAFYWADVTVLTIGLGSDFAPSTHTGRSLVIFFSVGGIIIIGLVIGSIRTLVLDRGKRKLSARIMEKKRLRAIGSIDTKRKTIKVSLFNTMHFDDEHLDMSKRRELEFYVMRGVQDHAERDRKWMALLISMTAFATLWFLGALVFYYTERPQQWTYFNAVYFSYTTLLTLGYGDLYPETYPGRAFFVLWTLLAVPTLTILISDMSETVISFVSNFMLWIGSITILPGEDGFHATLKTVVAQLPGGSMDTHFLHKKSKSKKNEKGGDGENDDDDDTDDAGPEDAEQGHSDFISPDAMDSAAGATHDAESKRRKPADTSAEMTERLTSHVEATELASALEDGRKGDSLGHDVHFYHVVLTREIRQLTRDLNADPPKRYQWSEWEYFLRLMDNIPTSSQMPLAESKGVEGESASDGRDEADEEHDDDDMEENLVPLALRGRQGSAHFASDPENRQFTWLGMESPLLSWQTETQWILERLGITLERELIRDRKVKEGKIRRRRPPISLADMVGHIKAGQKQKGGSDGEAEPASRQRPNGGDDVGGP